MRCCVVAVAVADDSVLLQLVVCLLHYSTLFELVSSTCLFPVRVLTTIAAVSTVWFGAFVSHVLQDTLPEPGTRIRHLFPFGLAFLTTGTFFFCSFVNNLTVVCAVLRHVVFIIVFNSKI